MQSDSEYLQAGDSAQNNPETGIQVTKSLQAFSGPLPHPTILREYEDILPGCAERILVMAEQEQIKRHERIEKDSTTLLAHSDRGQRFAFIICLVALSISGVLALTGHEVTASIIGGIDLVALSVVFVTGRKQS